MSFAMPAPEQLAPENHTTAAPDLSVLDDPSDLIEGNGQPIESPKPTEAAADESSEAPTPTPDNGPDLSILDEPDGESASETASSDATEPEVVDPTITTRDDWPEGKEPSNVVVLIEGCHFTGGHPYVVEYIDEDGSVIINDDSGEIYGLEDGDYQVATWADVGQEGDESSVGERQSETATAEEATDEQPKREYHHHGITHDHDRLIRLYNVELGIRKIEARIEDIKSDLKAEKERLDDQISYMRQLVSENDADENDAARPLLNPPKPAEPAATETSPPTPEDETNDESAAGDADDADDNNPDEYGTIVQRPLRIKVTVEQSVLDDESESESALTSGAEYDVVDFEDGDPIVNDNEDKESLLSDGEYEVVTWSDPVRVDDEGTPVVSKLEDWPEGKRPLKVSPTSHAVKTSKDLTIGKIYGVDAVVINNGELTITDDAGENYTLEDGDYYVVEWADIIPDPVNDDEWESLPIEELKLASGVQSAILANGIKTLGKLEAVRADGAEFTIIPGIGEKKGKAIEDAFEAFWAKRNAGK